MKTTIAIAGFVVLVIVVIVVFILFYRAIKSAPEIEEDKYYVDEKDIEIY